MEQNKNQLIIFVWGVISVLLFAAYDLMYIMLPHAGNFALYTMSLGHILLLVFGITLAVGGILLIVREKNFFHYFLALIVMIFGVVSCIISVRSLLTDYKDLACEKETVLLEKCVYKHVRNSFYSRKTLLFGDSKGKVLQFDMTGCPASDLKKICDDAYPVILKVHPNTGYVFQYDICTSMQRYAEVLPDETLMETAFPQDDESYDFDKRILLAEDRAHHIRLYGIHLGDDDISLITIDGDRVIFEYKWYTPDRLLPTIDVRDIDKDGQEEILLVHNYLFPNLGTPCAELTVLHKSKSGEWLTATLSSDKINDALSPRAKLTYNNATWVSDLALGKTVVQSYRSPVKLDMKDCDYIPIYTYSIDTHYMKLSFTPALLKHETNEIVHQFAPVTVPIIYKNGKLTVPGSS